MVRSASDEPAPASDGGGTRPPPSPPDGARSAATAGDGSSPAVPDFTGAAVDVIGTAVAERLRRFVGDGVAHLGSLDPALERLGATVSRLVEAGGKRLRPAFVYWGYRATGADHDDAVYTPAAAVELVHAFALIQDDVMDRSPTRRGAPAAHVALAGAHEEAGHRGDPEWFGVSGAILAGDLATAWAARLFEETELPAPAVADARRVFTQLQVEVIAGQYLELWHTGRTVTEDEALRVGLLKSGRYTVTRPLQIGATLGGGGSGLDEALVRYGDAVGLAFQLRDDILGLFGDPEVTGKSTIDDLREGKRTLLVVWALQRATATDRTFLERRLGDPDVDADDVDRVREIVTRTRALADVEALLIRHRATAVRALDDMPSATYEALSQLTEIALHRDT